MSKVTGRKKRIIITTAAMLAVGGGAAFAYWTATGIGNTTASSETTSSNFTITSTVTGGALSPGGPTQTFTFVVTNPGTGVQKLSAVAATVATTTGAAWTTVPGCSAADFTVGDPAFTAGEIAPNGTVTGTVTLQMKNLTGVDQNGCKGATVPLHFAAS
jgi:hypothetical protein